MVKRFANTLAVVVVALWTILAAAQDAAPPDQPTSLVDLPASVDSQDIPPQEVGHSIEALDHSVHSDVTELFGGVQPQIQPLPATVGISTWGVSKWGISKWGINRTGSEAGRDSSLKSSFGMLKISPRQSELEQAEADADADQAKTQDTKTQNTKIQNTNDASSPAAKPAITAVKKQPRLALPVAFASTEDTPSFERHSLFGTERQGDYANPFTHKLPSSLSIQKEAPADKKTKKTHKQQMGKDSEKDLEKHLSHSDRLNSKQNAKSKSRSMNDY